MIIKNRPKFNCSFLNSTLLMRYCALVLLLLTPMLSSASEQLEKDFKNPPHASKPKTWLHSMNGNMSKIGFTKDLEAIADAGIGGVLLFNVSHNIPKGNVIFNSERHHDIIAHAAKESERLGLSFGVHNCDGWTSSGGPWITPEKSMKMLAWNETIVDGGKVTVQLPSPTARRGFFRDVAVIAYPSLSAELYDAESTLKLTSSDPDFDARVVSDGRWDQFSELDASEKEPGWILFDFGTTRVVRSLNASLSKSISGSRNFQLLKSDDGKNFEQVLSSSLKRLGKLEFGIDETFAESKARFFKLLIEDDYKIREVALTSRGNLDNYLARSSLFKVEDHKLRPLAKTDSDATIPSGDVRDLSPNMSSSGLLETTLPDGKWTILRFAYTTTGAVNGPASEEGRGLEVDKMDPDALDIHYQAYVGKVIENTRDIAPNALQYIEIDSYEVGGQNWTKGYRSLFEKEYGYNLTRFLPLYAGRIVDDHASSDDILEDIRRFNSKLLTDNYFGRFQELVKGDGLVTYTEPYSFNGPFNELDAGKFADIPMGEFWMHQRYQTGTAVSSARIYGKPIVSAESFSALPDINWRGHPGFAKSTGDHAWTLGINEFMFHRYAHQANTHVKPGMTMSIWGSHIDRTQTWWDNAGAAWFEYIARGSHLLRQGLPVSDVLVFVGEGTPSSVIERKNFSPKLPNEINFDNINADALVHRISFKDNALKLPEGTAYKVLVLKNSDRMSLKVLKKIDRLSKRGAIIVGEKPTQLIGYLGAHSRATKKKFASIADRIWQRPKTYTKFDWEKIFQNNNISLDLSSKSKNLPSYTHRKLDNTDIYFFSNTDDVARSDVFNFRVKNKVPELWDPLSGNIRKLAHFSESDTHTQVPLYLEPGESVFVVFRQALGSRAYVQKTDLSPENGAFLFDNLSDEIYVEANSNGDFMAELSDASAWQAKVDSVPKPKTIEGPWTVTFDTSAGLEKPVKTETLFDWSASEIFDVKHYSGTASYSTDFFLDEQFIQSNNEYILDLGAVNIAAEVFINDASAGISWSSPHRIKVKTPLKKGKNTLRIEVTNTWTNRLIGDESYARTDGYAPKGVTQPGIMPAWYVNNEPLPAGKRTTFTTYNFYEIDRKLEPSGLLGPVKISAYGKAVRK